MAAPINIAILGFSAFERNALAAHLRIAQDRTPSYRMVLDVDEATFVIVDADQGGAAELLRELGRIDDAVFVGAGAPPEAAAWMMRPIDPVNVMREFDRLLFQRENPASRPMPLGLPSTPGVLRGADAAAAQPSAMPTPARRAGDASPAGTAPVAERRSGTRRPARAAGATRPIGRALLVDDSEVALHHLRRRLEPFGIAADFAYDSGEAVERLAERDYGVVFLDVDLGEGSELDGLALCKRIKARAVSGMASAPTVVLVSAFQDAVHRVRGTLAGADDFLGKPLEVAALMRLMTRLGVSAATSALPAHPARPT